MSSLQPEHLAFVDFVLHEYVESGIDELGIDKLPTLLHRVHRLSG